MYLSDDLRLIEDEGIRKMMRAAKRYHLASLQDDNLYVAAKHNGYAAAIIWKLQDLASPDQVLSASGEDVNTLKDEIMRVQDEHEGKALKIMEKLKAKGIDLTGISKESFEKLLSHL